MKSKIRNLKWLLLAVAMALVATACTSAQEEAAVTKPVIKLAQRGWLGFELNNAVARILLEEETGYRVETIEVEGATQFESLAKGETHVNLEIWVGGWMEDYQKYVEEEGSVEDGGPLGVVGKIGWFIPTYLLDEHPELATWEGFKDPEIAALFSTDATGDKGQFTHADPDYVCAADDLMRNLGLPFEVVHAGSEEALIAAVEEAFSNQEPLLFYFWSPHWLFAKYEITEVELPPHSKECYDDKVDLDDVSCGYPAEILRKALWPGLKDHAPEAYQFLKSFSYTTEDQITMLALVEVEGKTVEEAARFWIEQNENVWRAWIP